MGGQCSKQNRQNDIIKVFEGLGGQEYLLLLQRLRLGPYYSHVDILCGFHRPQECI